MTSFARILLFLTVGLSFSSPAPAQFGLLYQKDGTTIAENLGVSVASAGDVNGDGKADFIVGAYGNNSSRGSAFVYSGATGGLLYQRDGAVAADNLGQSVAGVGDVNGDGRSDFIVGAWGANPSAISNAGSSFLYSGATGALLYQKNGSSVDGYLGYSVAGVGDVNGDGRPDFIVSHHQADPGGLTNAGSAYVYSGMTGALLYTKNGAVSGKLFGWSVAGAGDVNGDGRADFIIGTPWPGASANDGAAFVYSGATGALLYQKNGTLNSGEHLGSSVGGVGDLNGDGKGEFIIGAEGAGSTGSAYVYSGMDGSLLYQKNGPAAGYLFGAAVAGTGDVDGDAKPDFIVGAYSGDPGAGPETGAAFLYSGADGSLLFQKDGTLAGIRMGSSVAGAGDVNGDGTGDIIIGAMWNRPGGVGQAGSAFVYTKTSCAAAKGDMDGSGGLLDAADVVLMLTCVFLGTGNCDPCFSDVDCSGGLPDAADVVQLMNAVFLGTPFSGC